MQTRTHQVLNHTLADASRADDSGAAHQDTRQADSGAASPAAGAAQGADWIEVGLIRSVHGLRGEVKVEPLTDSPANRLGTGGARHVADHIARDAVQHGSDCAPALQCGHLRCRERIHSTASRIAQLFAGGCSSLRRLGGDSSSCRRQRRCVLRPGAPLSAR
jgi:RimM N-terminal domain